MKYLILLLISFNSYADIKLDFVLPNKSVSVTFETIEEAQKNFDDNKDNKSWGHRDKWEKRNDNEVCSGLERQVGDIINGFFYECFKPANYTVCGQNPDQLNIATHCEDITAQVNAKKAKKDADALTLDSIKAKLIDGSAKLDDLIQYIKINKTYTPTSPERCYTGRHHTTPLRCS